jgi:hypothetical protein
MAIVIYLLDGRSVQITGVSPDEIEKQIGSAMANGSLVKIADQIQVHLINPNSITEVLITPDSD